MFYLNTKHFYVNYLNVREKNQFLRVSEAADSDGSTSEEDIYDVDTDEDYDQPSVYKVSSTIFDGLSKRFQGAWKKRAQRFNRRPGPVFGLFEGEDHLPIESAADEFCTELRLAHRAFFKQVRFQLRKNVGNESRLTAQIPRGYRVTVGLGVYVSYRMEHLFFSSLFLSKQHVLNPLIVSKTNSLISIHILSADIAAKLLKLDGGCYSEVDLNEIASSRLCPKAGFIDSQGREFYGYILYERHNKTLGIIIIDNDAQLSRKFPKPEFDRATKKYVLDGRMRRGFKMISIEPVCIQYGFRRNDSFRLISQKVVQNKRTRVIDTSLSSQYCFYDNYIVRILSYQIRTLLLCI